MRDFGLSLAPLLAHYGGIDEIGIFVVPALAVIVILRWAERRARRRAEAAQFGAQDPTADENPRPGRGEVS